MGCGQSTPAAVVAAKDLPATAPVEAKVVKDTKTSTAPNVNGKAAHHATTQDGRIESIPETCTVTFGNVSVRYAYLSRRGYYPTDLNKANQDSYSVTHKFSGIEGDSFFGVYDGHGPAGDKCSQYVRDHLPSILAIGIGGDPDLPKDKLDDLIHKSHIACNKKMHRDRRVDDKYSGSTAISVYLQGNENKITISNVGDSRAILGHMDEDPDTDAPILLASSLSSDQTPWRRDERARIQKNGGRILTEDQLNGKVPIEKDEDGKDKIWASHRGGLGQMELGEEIDKSGQPPRVFSPHGDYPGLALTRTIGDKIINDERVGVNSEPEILTRELTEDDKIIVLASDGVWEFMTNKTVIDMCAESKDPLKACQAVVAKSHDHWMKHDTRSDDISMICIFVDGVNKGGVDPEQ